MEAARRERRTPRRMISVLAVSVLGVGLLAAVAPGTAAAGTKTCWVKNVTLAKSYGPAMGSVLQGAIDKAGAGNTLEVRGLCVGNFAISKDLTLVGVAKSGYPVATLDGGYVTGSTIFPGVVLAISAGATVAVSNLTIQHGADGGDVGGVYNRGSLSLSHSTVSNNTGSGIVNIGSPLTLVSSSVTGNVVFKGAAGIYSDHDVTLTDTSVSLNAAGSSGFTGGGGVYIYSPNGSDFPTLTLNGSSSVTGNRSNASGGGVDASQADVVMNGTSSVTGNHADYDNDGIGTGGGIFICAGSVTGPAAANVTLNYRGSGTSTIDNISSCT